MGSPRAGGQNQGQAVRAARARSGVILLLFLCSMRGRRLNPGLSAATEFLRPDAIRTAPRAGALKVVY